MTSQPLARKESDQRLASGVALVSDVCDVGMKFYALINEREWTYVAAACSICAAVPRRIFNIIIRTVCEFYPITLRSFYSLVSENTSHKINSLTESTQKPQATHVLAITLMRKT